MLSKINRNIYPLSIVFIMLCGFLLNRVVSNIGLFLSAIYTLYYFNYVKWLFKDKFYLSFVGICLIALVSDILYVGIDFYQERGIMKAILILIPLFIFSVQDKKHFIKYTSYLVIFIMGISTIYSIAAYVSNIEYVRQAYKMSKVIPVLAYRDHIRISWMTVIAILLSVKILSENRSKYDILLTGYILVQVLFLHLLGAKTGLVILYLSLTLLLIYSLWKKYTSYLIMSLIIIGLLPIIAFNTLPTFEQRMRYVYYDYEQYSQGKYISGLSDAVRFYSIKGGIYLFSTQPLIGVGFAPLKDKMTEWYKKFLPEMNEESYFLPSSQYLIYAAGAGIIGLGVLLFHFIIPFFYTYLRHDRYFTIYFLGCIVSFTFETHLENQLSLWVYAFFTSYFWLMAAPHNNTSHSPHKMISVQ